MKAFRPISTLSNGLLNTSTRTTALTCRAAYLGHDYTNHRPQQRNFSNPFTQNQTLTASRTLRYPSSVVFNIISDVSSYHQFLPYCRSSKVTKWSAAAENGKQYPEEAELVIGFNDNIQEKFTSRVYCVPERIVEAVSGAQQSTLLPDQIPHHSARPPADQDPSRNDTVMASLLTRWTLNPYPYKPPPTGATSPESTHKNHEETNPVPGQEKTEVNLAIEFTFANPLYAAVSAGAAPKVAERMIEAFEERVKAVLEGPGNAKKKKEMESLMKSKAKA